ncbi:MAG: type II secretion system protein [Planctomycetota bacterium]
MKHKKTGLTIIELLIVLGIISILVGLLVPSLTAVRKKAREVKQKAQFATIELALAAFKNDDGDYPPSNWTPAPFSGDYCGAQKLAEALLGWDLLGFHPKSAWRADGLDLGGGPMTYDPAQTRDNNPPPSGNGIPDTFDERKGPYLQLATTNAFRLGNVSISKLGLFADTGPLAPDTFVLCDVFGSKKISMTDGTLVKAGSPILYFKADTTAKTIRGIYRIVDNEAIVVMKQQVDGRIHPLVDPTNAYQFFYGNDDPLDNIVGRIEDQKIKARIWPYRPSSYILISAGADGIYGTEDDITNFGN